MIDSQTDEDSNEELLGILASEFSDRIGRGEHPSIEEYAVRHPEIGELIRDLFPALLAIQERLDSQRIESPFSDQATLGEFTIVREIGRGGMGIVYEALQRSMRRSVALKILPTASQIEPRRLKRFQNEVRAAATLDHPHIVAIHSVGEEGGIHYYAMQLVRGTSLAEVLRRLRSSEFGLAQGLDEHSIAQAVSTWTSTFALQTPTGEGLDRTAGPDSAGGSATSDSGGRLLVEARGTAGPTTYRVDGYFRAVAQLVADVAGALEHAHQHGIVHRDIKPANLLVSQQGKVRVTDFGVARIADDATLSLASELVGTLRYMAPEQALGSGAVDHRADVYSLGATLYEMLTLEPVFLTDDRLSLLHQIAHQEPRRPKAIEPTVPADLQTIALKALHKDPSNRYTSAAEMQQDLIRFLDNRPILAVPPGVFDHLAKGVKRHPWTASLLAFFMLSLIIFSFMMTREARRAERALDTTTDLLYASDMRTASQILAAGELYRAMSLLERYHPKAGETDRRDFVWHYLNGRIHYGESIRSTEAWGPARWICRSPDGTQFATGHENGVVVIWASDQWQPVATLQGHRETVSRVEFLPDGRRLVSADESGEIRVWDLSSNQTLAKLQCPGNRYEGLAVTPDAKTIFVAVDKQILAWDGTETVPIPFEETHVARLTGIAVSPDGTRLASVDRSNQIVIWRLPSCRVLQQRDFEADAPLFVAVRYHADSKRLLVGTQQGQLAVVDLDDHTLGPLRAIHSSNIYSMELSLDSQSLLTASKDMTVKLTRLDRLNETPIVLQHSRRAYCAAFLSDGRLVSTSRDNTLRIWPRLTPGHRITEHQGTAGSSDFDARRETLYMASPQGFVSVTPVNGQDHRYLPLLLHSPSVISAHRQPYLLIAGAETVHQGKILRDATKQWMEYDLDGDGDLDLVANLQARGILIEQERDAGRWLRPRLCREALELGWNELMFPASDPSQAEMWGTQADLGGFQIVRGQSTALKHLGLALPASFDVADLDGDGTRDLILSTRLDKTLSWYPSIERVGFADQHVIAKDLGRLGDILVIDVNHDSLLDVVMAGEDALMCIVQQPDHSYSEPMEVGRPGWSPQDVELVRMEFVDVNGDRNLDLVAVGPRQAVWYLRNDDGSLAPEAHLIDDLRQATWLPTLTSHAVVWNTETNRLLNHFHLPLQGGRRAAISRDDALLATASSESAVAIWHFPDGQWLHSLPSFENAVGGLVWSHDGTLLYVGSGDNVHIWDRIQKRMLRTWRIHENTVSDIAVSHDGATVVTLSHDLTVRLWDPDGVSPRKTLLGHSQHPIVACFSPDDRLLATMGRKGVVYLWHVATGQLMMTLDDFPVDEGLDLEFRDDRTLIAVGLRNKQPFCCVWEAAKGRLP